MNMWFKILSFGLLFLSVSGFVPIVKNINGPSFANEIELWAKLDFETELFKDITRVLKIPEEFQNLDWRSLAEEKSNSMCHICQGTVESFLKMRREGTSEEDIKNKLIKLCTLLNIQTENICKGVIELNLPTVIYIVDSKPNLTAATICGVIFESKLCPLNNPEFEWSINISENNSNIVITENKTEEQIKILQITDLHYDPLYEVNGNANCGEPVCCRKGQNKTNANSLAGYWGDYESCDTPWHAVTDALTHIKDTHQDINFTYFTGDIIDHGVWETSIERNTESLLKVYNEMHDIMKDTVVYPIFGNHEPHPLNQFAPNITPDYLSTSWLYNLLANLWIGYGWLPETTRSTILQGGYYTVTPKKGFRIIALNSNVCYTYNWWLWYNPRDPDNQLQWLADTLLEAEKNNEFVHILSHMPANSNSCLKTWKREYLRIINRFSHLIKAEFNGHTHNDEIAVFYNSDTEATNVAWNGGGITTYSRLNPNYKIYTVNSSNYAVTDYENWMYDLGIANKNIHTKPTWYKSYSFKTEYGLSDLSPTSLSNWLSLAVKNETLLNTYYRNFYKQAKPSLQRTCNLNCKRQLLCRIVTNLNADFCN